MRALLTTGADKDLAENRGATPLFIAVQEGHDACARALLDAGADKDLARTDGCNPLLIAAQCGHDASVRLLIERDADVDVEIAMRANGRTPLIVAADIGNDSTVGVLLSAGANSTAETTAEHFEIPAGSTALSMSPSPSSGDTGVGPWGTHEDGEHCPWRRARQGTNNYAKAVRLLEMHGSAYSCGGLKPPYSRTWQRERRSRSGRRIRPRRPSLSSRRSTRRGR